MPITPLPLPSAQAGLLLPDWRAPVEIVHGYLTAIERSGTTAAEERRTLRTVPERVFKGTTTQLSRIGGERLRQAARRISQENQPWPWWPDIRPLTADASTGSGVSLMCDTTYARYLTGARAFVFDVENGEATNVELRTMGTVLSDRFSVDTLGTARTAGKSFVAPAADLAIHLSQELEMLSGWYASTAVNLREEPGASAFPAIGSYPPSGFSTYGDDPVLSVAVDWGFTVQRGVLRSGYEAQVGRYSHVYGFATSKEVVKFGIQMTSRASSWDVFRFIDSLRGRARPFWIVAPEERFMVVGYGSDWIDVEPLEDVADAEASSRIALVAEGGAATILTPQSWTDYGTYYRVQFSSSFTMPSRLDRISDAYHVRLSEDSWTERWITDAIGELQIVCEELTGEGEVALTGVPSEF